MSGGPDRAGAAAKPEPIVELRNAGVYFHLHRRKKINLRQAILRRQWISQHEVLWALRHVDLELYEGQVLGMIGHNGAGKSTLCLILSQILQPDEGEVIVRGKVSQLVSLGAGLNSDLSGRANVRLYAAYLGISRKEVDAKIDEIIAFSELGDFIDEPMRHYSSGMRARLGFAVASSLDPEILILDEVFSVGDAKFRRKSELRLEEMMARCRLIVVVSHSSDFLRKIATHCLWLRQGRLVRFGKAAEVLDEYDEAMGGRVDPDLGPDPA